MFRPRLIPVLLLDGWGASKTIQFRNRINLGDPVNAVSILNNFRVDEIVVLDINATSRDKPINYELLKDIAEEANMPFSIGGGIKNLDQISKLLSIGAEKVVISSAIYQDPKFVTRAVNTFGSSSITACVDVGKDWLKRSVVYSNSGKLKISASPLAVAKQAEDLGVGEIIIQSISNDGMMKGYDVGLLSKISSLLRIPVVALGGAGTLQHMLDVYAQTEVSALASGSFFFFKGPQQGVLISYPEFNDLKRFSKLRVDHSI